MSEGTTRDGMRRVEDPLADARRRGADARQRLIEDASGPLRLGEAAERLGISSRAVTGRRMRGTIPAVPAPTGKWVYPACPFDAHGLIPGVSKVLRAFREDVDP